MYRQEPKFGDKLQKIPFVQKILNSQKEKRFKL